MKIKAKHTITGKIEILDEFVVNQNPYFEAIDSGAHIEEQAKKVNDAWDKRAESYKNRNRVQKNTPTQTATKKHSNKRFIGYGEDEGDDYAARMMGQS